MIYHTRLCRLCRLSPTTVQAYTSQPNMRDMLRDFDKNNTKTLDEVGGFSSDNSVVSDGQQLKLFGYDAQVILSESLKKKLLPGHFT